VLYMSGYSEDVIGSRGVLDPGLAFLAKPFTEQDLLVKVRAVLEAPRARGRILVADDDEAIRKLFGSILSAAGYEVVQAEDGAQALKLIGDRPFDVLITDLVMPNREGLEIIRAIRKGRSRLKIIAVSGALGGSFLGVAAALGADLALAKPVGPAELVAAVERLLA
jgi:DNA-binding response OmpR family regulator